MNYYNELDPKAAAWLRVLISEGHMPKGEVDERSITEIQPADLVGFRQCHFFAGIGGWPLALRLADVPDDEFIWTGSCPCQPFSDAGLGLGEADPRHLWPVWFKLVAQCAPAIVFGEQVASKAALGWLDGVFADLEGADYACAASDLCAAGVGAPHIRQRLFWMAYANGGDASAERKQCGGKQRLFQEGRGVIGLGDTDSSGLSQQCGTVAVPSEQSAIELRGDAGGLADAGHESEGRSARCGETQSGRTFRDSSGRGTWSNFDLLPCTDGKTRRIESGTFPLAYGVPERVGRLRGYGNAIVPQVAAEFIRASFEALAEQ